MTSGWERLFWLVFQRTSNAIILLDDGRRVTSVNAAASKLLQRNAAELQGISIDELIVPPERAQAAREWQEFLRCGEYSGERDLIRRDGSVVHIQFAARLADVGERRLAVYVVMVRPANAQSARTHADASASLTEREREIVTLIALGQETKAIAQELQISPETVRTHVRNAMTKLGARTRAQLVASVLCHERALNETVLDNR